MIYLDNAATTKPDPAVIEAMLPFLEAEYGNAGASYAFGKVAAGAVAEARRSVAALIGADPSQIVFTSGGTEANNMVFNCLIDALEKAGKTTVITDKTEHPSVLKPIENLCVKRGFHARYLPVNEDGTVNYSGLSAMLDDTVGIVSVMYVNNETGAENDVTEIAAICKEKGVLFHTDCVQAAGSHPIDVKKTACDFLSISAHKLHGVKGVGALYIRDKTLVSPMILGGSFQEGGLRGGTENVPGIVAFGKAAALAKEGLHENDVYVSTLRQIFYTTLTETLEEKGFSNAVAVNGPSVVHHGKILSLRVPNADGETLALLMGAAGICISTGSACHAYASLPSAGLMALGLSAEEARSSVRLSFSRFNTQTEVVQAAKKLASVIVSLLSC